MKENCVLQPDGSFTLADMMDAYQNCWGKSMSRTTLAGQLDRAGYIKSHKDIEVTIGDKVTKRNKNVYVPDGHEIKE
jgi:hypothetical protein